MSTRRSVFLCALVACLLALATARSFEPAPTFVINLDEAPETRWKAVYDAYQGSFSPILNYLNSLLSPEVQAVLDPIMAALDGFLPSDISRELKGISQYPGVPFNLGQLVILNLIYELTAFCTSIVAQHPDGTIYHSRNLDYGIPGLTNITIQVQFQKSNTTLYECTTFAGYVGCLTGIRSGGWSVTVNERDQAGSSLIDNLVEALKGGKSIGMFLRNSLETIPDYPTALKMVTDTQLIAPVYITIAGVSAGQAAVVTRNRTVADDVWPIDTTEGRWWVLETNDDHWKPPEDHRRDVANQGMKDLGQNNLSNAGLFNVLSTKPVFNSDTVYTANMIPATGYAAAYIRYDAPSNLPKNAKVW